MKITTNPFRNFIVTEYKHKGKIVEKGDIRFKGAHVFYANVEHRILPINFEGELEIRSEETEVNSQKEIFHFTAMLMTNLMQDLYETLNYKNDEFGFCEDKQEWFIFDEDGNKIYESEYSPNDTNGVL